MTDALRHRGPDDAGAFTSDFRLRPPYEALPGVALGHRRLSIIDVAGGHQPMSNEDGSGAGRLQRRDLQLPRRCGGGWKGRATSFARTATPKTIVHLYEDEGPDCFTHLNGMFAIAIWDASRRRLVLGRDRSGKKPLVYRHEPGRLLFASELKSLLQVPGLPREIDPAAIDEYLTYQYVPHPNTIFRGFRKLPPGARGDLAGRPARSVARTGSPISLANDRTRRSRCRRRTARDCSTISGENAAAERRAARGVSVRRRRFVADRRADAEAQRRAGEDVHASAFRSRSTTRSSYAARRGRALGDRASRIRKSRPTRSRFCRSWPGTTTNRSPTARRFRPGIVSQLTREHVTVALSGDGGDELFAGYPRYQALRLGGLFDQLPDPLRAIVRRRVWQWLPSSGRQKSRLRQFKRFSEALRQPPARRYLDWISIFNEARRGELYTDDVRPSQLPDCDPVRLSATAWQRSGKDATRSAASLRRSGDVFAVRLDDTRSISPRWRTASNAANRFSITASWNLPCNCRVHASYRCGAANGSCAKPSPTRFRPGSGDEKRWASACRSIIGFAPS